MANGCDIDFIAVTSAVTIVTITLWVITSELDDADDSSRPCIPCRSYVWPVNCRHSL